MIAGLSPRGLGLAAAAGVALGMIYTLSPLTVWFGLAFVLICRALVRDLDAEERRVVLAILIVATVTRLAVVAGLFVTTDHWLVPYGSLFGDEEYFKKRSMWLRSMAIGVHISQQDREYAMDEYSDTSYLDVLAFVQILVGSAPYGVHLLGIAAYLAAAVLLYRFMRRTFGPPSAVVSFVLLLFFPSLFFWSVSALRESLHLLLTAMALVGGVEIVRRSTPWRVRAGWALLAVAACAALRDLRAGSMMVVTVSVACGLAAALVTTRRRLLAAGVLCVMAIGVAAVSQPGISDRVLKATRDNALNHQGHVFTPGFSYKLLPPEHYLERRTGVMDWMTWPDAAQYIVRALVALIAVPYPWQPQSNLTRAYLPEQVAWYGLIVLLPVGVWCARRQNPAATYIIAAYIAIMGTGIALRSGNIGTLVRHRGFLLPFIICLSAVAICNLLARVPSRQTDPPSVFTPPAERTL